MTVTEEPLHVPGLTEDMVREAIYQARLFDERWECNVATARALGWEDVCCHTTPPQGETCLSVTYWTGRPPGREHHEQVPNYVQSGWAEILERERYQVTPWNAENKVWSANGGTPHQEAWGDTPGEAVCRLFCLTHAEKENS